MAQSGRQLDFHSMEHRLRVCALVGRYLQIFAFAEAEIDDTLAKILGLSNLQSFILGDNLPFGNKMHVLLTLLDLSYLTIKQKEEYAHVLNRMLSYASGHRNTIAHVMFSESPVSDGDCREGSYPVASEKAAFAMHCKVMRLVLVRQPDNSLPKRRALFSGFWEPYCPSTI